MAESFADVFARVNPDVADKVECFTISRDGEHGFGVFLRGTDKRHSVIMEQPTTRALDELIAEQLGDWVREQLAETAAA